jgi:hypothetical protein
VNEYQPDLQAAVDARVKDTVIISRCCPTCDSYKERVAELERERAIVMTERNHYFEQGIDAQKERDALKVKLDAMMALLVEIRNQLYAMDCSPAHAVSWVRPKSNATRDAIYKIDAAIAAERGKS